VAQAERAGATALMTTEKDLVRLGSLAAAIPEPLLLKAASLQVEIENQPEAIDWIVARVADVSETRRSLC
jgi:tetraacyldisaccharide-1-P 4'-kinase